MNGGHFMKYVDKRKIQKIEDFRQLVFSAAERFGDKILYASPKKDGYRFTYNDFKRDIISFGTALIERGIKDQKIAVMGEAHPAYMTAYYGTTISGNVIVPLDKELQIKEVVNFLNRAKAVAIVYMPSMKDTIINHKDELEYTKLFIPVEPEHEGEEDVITFSDFLAEGKAAYDNGNDEFCTMPIDRERMCTLLFTSGTTGTSKGVMLCMRNLCASANDACKCTVFDGDNVLLSVLPMNHVYESTCGHIAAINLGITEYLNDSLKYVMRNIKAAKPDTMVLVPLFLETMHRAIWKGIDKKGMRKKVNFGIKLSRLLLKLGIDVKRKIFADILNEFGGRLQFVISGGAALSKDIIRDFHDFGIEINEGYGITECSPLLAVNRPYDVVYGSVGRAVPACEVKIDSPNEEGIGEIVAKGDNVMLGYYENEEATKEAFTEDGWFRTGDLGYIDDKGNIFITGRKKNLIILSNGKNIYPEEIEEHLYHSEYIAECVVIERQSDIGEQLITALIYPNQDLVEGMNKEAIFDKIKSEVDAINEDLPPFKQVNQIEVRDTEFEKTTSKKIKRYILK